jgi:hypothetical protein
VRFRFRAQKGDEHVVTAIERDHLPWPAPHAGHGSTSEGRP